jgi:hypothetical protein
MLMAPEKRVYRLGFVYSEQSCVKMLHALTPNNAAKPTTQNSLENALKIWIKKFSMMH